MHVDADDLVQAALQGGAGVQPFRVGRREQPPQGVEEEGAGAAGRVQDALFQRTVNGFGAHAGGQPVGGVVLAEVVAVLGINQGLVEALEDVGLDLVEPEASDVLGDATHQFGTRRRGQNPIEEVGLHDARDTGLLERTTRE